MKTINLTIKLNVTKLASSKLTPHFFNERKVGNKDNNYLRAGLAGQHRQQIKSDARSRSYKFQSSQIFHNFVALVVCFFKKKMPLIPPSVLTDCPATPCKSSDTNIRLATFQKNFFDVVDPGFCAYLNAFMGGAPFQNTKGYNAFSNIFLVVAYTQWAFVNNSPLAVHCAFNQLVDLQQIISRKLSAIKAPSDSLVFIINHYSEFLRVARQHLASSSSSSLINVDSIDDLLCAQRAVLNAFFTY